MRVYAVRVGAQNARNDLVGALHTGLETLRLLGVELPEKPNQLSVVNTTYSKVTLSDLRPSRNELRRAIRREQFTLAYQPKVLMRTGQTIGVEALIRWKHPDLGDIGPNRFIPVAEEAGLIGEVGRYVVMTATWQVQAWQDAGLRPIPVAVNVSAAQLRQPDFVETLRAILSEVGLIGAFGIRGSPGPRQHLQAGEAS